MIIERSRRFEKDFQKLSQSTKNFFRERAPTVSYMNKSCTNAVFFGIFRIGIITLVTG